MKYTELKDKSIKELEELLHAKKAELFELHVKLKTMQLSNPNEIKKTRRNIARINTAINAYYSSSVE
ncbi:50S ribosomal protein L29 [Helicobacter pylori]|uniref:50S ribosomal protein L29 n=1 Tax=Helicobacter pylori TaxID=210 RepID=UPI0009588EAC|nr:50S ribosomal protein L29 [Helicobacter pylori]WRE62770.1 50S ribosomal protein L29 [Helicobacter pylori]BAW66301.1 50S ribosomal protein L29 [Helicobacter pylori]